MRLTKWLDRIGKDIDEEALIVTFFVVAILFILNQLGVFSCS